MVCEKLCDARVYESCGDIQEALYAVYSDVVAEWCFDEQVRKGFRGKKRGQMAGGGGGQGSCWSQSRMG